MNEFHIISKLADHGLIINGKLEFSKWASCHTSTRPTGQAKDGKYRIFDKTVSYSSWNGSIEDGWFFIEDAKPLTPEDKKAYAERKRQEEINYKQREIERQAKDKLEISEKIDKVNKTYANCHSLTNHVYLLKKKMPIHTDFRMNKYGDLIIPLRDYEGNITAHQQIYAIMPADGNDKKIHGVAKESFFTFKPESCELKELDMVFVCEGVATGYAVYNAMNEYWDGINYGVVCAMSSGNIDPVINRLRKELPPKFYLVIQDMDMAGIKSKNIGFPLGFTQGQDAWDIWNEFGKESLANLIQDKLMTMTNDIKKIAA